MNRAPEAVTTYSQGEGATFIVSAPMTARRTYPLETSIASRIGINLPPSE